ncbi:MAG: metalloregulator ArsR/SmtB family transcription factor [Paracoccaceae bacterium]|nr:metalloregulator ArsR/SmtB family transcription factor [Paracoccaceae bacterium]
MKAVIFNCMVEHDLNRIFHALSDPTRRAILDRLAAGEATISHLSQPFPLSFAAVSKHLGVLEHAGLVTREKRGRERVCRINPAALEDAHTWLEFHEHFWTSRLEALDALVGASPDNLDE